MRLRDRLTLPWLLWRGLAAARHAAARGCVGLDFDRYGRRLGWRLLLRGHRLGARLLIAPVSITRYFEFEFAADCLPPNPRELLDVGSPRLFSIRFAEEHADASVRMLNPDARDAFNTRRLGRALGLKNLVVEEAPVAALQERPASFDCIWSLSVVEHIAGDYDDRAAMKAMYDALNPGGTLLLSVPVGRRAGDEYSDVNHYGMRDARAGPPHFFQRLYDEATIEKRLLGPIGREPERQRWFGETTPGRFEAYCRRWRQRGFGHVVDDPREIADHYREYETWDEMPGQGVCCLMVTRP